MTHEDMARTTCSLCTTTCRFRPCALQGVVHPDIATALMVRHAVCWKGAAAAAPCQAWVEQGKYF